ncbi:cysteine-rich CWC family protein [Paenibacillus barcinonensis]|uniref:Cysteine-rich CWC family protein n=2 Tax=Paenibacillus barcinonensis TaxID=198119 RepID=A0ABX6QEG9_PAEBA|nr:cysteine-rich CWC family protein [Paenibacillus barcinonensis]
MHQAKTNTDNGVVCPLCGESNGCTYAAGKPHSECWCNHASFPEGVLERIPAEHRLKSCICQRCLDSYVREQV